MSAIRVKTSAFGAMWITTTSAATKIRAHILRMFVEPR